MAIESLPEEHEGAKLKLVFGILFLILVIGLLVVYWIVPRGSIVNLINSHGEFLSCSNYEFGNDSDIQFYKNMRYVDSHISYKIEDCPIGKTLEMKNAFYEIENETILSFYEVYDNEEITVTCDSKSRLEDGMFIAGEGGPSNITKLSSSHVILNGKVLLIRQSTCERPVVAIHELFHALGFTHSNNVCNIMYNFSGCNQRIGDDMINLLDQLYSYQPLPDLKIEDLSGKINKEYLDLNFTIQNDGLLDSESFVVEIYSNKKLVKELDMSKIHFGTGATLILKNLQTRVGDTQIKVMIKYDSAELNKSNNVGELFLS